MVHSRLPFRLPFRARRTTRSSLVEEAGREREDDAGDVRLPEKRVGGESSLGRGAPERSLELDASEKVKKGKRKRKEKTAFFFRPLSLSLLSLSLSL